jgi:hypothetical protein
LKPAAAHLRAWPAPPLPSITRIDAPLTVEGLRPPGGLRAPMRIAETGFHVKAQFRNAYETFNGRYSFGPPIGEAFVRPEDRRVVQYFSGALLAYYPEAGELPGFAELLPEQQLQLLIRPANLGEQLLAERGVAARQHEVDGEFNAVYRALGGRWRFGVAISPKLDEPVNGVMSRVQYFQHGSIQRNPLTGAVEPGALGTGAWEARCAALGE